MRLPCISKNIKVGKMLQLALSPYFSILDFGPHFDTCIALFLG